MVSWPHRFAMTNRWGHHASNGYVWIGKRHPDLNQGPGAKATKPGLLYIAYSSPGPQSICTKPIYILYIDLAHSESVPQQTSTRSSTWPNNNILYYTLRIPLSYSSTQSMQWHSPGIRVCSGNHMAIRACSDIPGASEYAVTAVMLADQFSGTPRCLGVPLNWYCFW